MKTIFYFLFTCAALTTSYCYSQVTTISQTDIGGNWYSGVDDWGGQSFYINQAGYITEIRFYCHNPEGITTFEIREGENTAGTLLYTTSINITGSAYWMSVPVPNVPVCEGQYCFLVSGFQWGALNVSDPYPSGAARYSGFWTPTQDMAFEVDQIINEEPISTSSFPNVSVCAGNSVPTMNFNVTDESPTAVVVSATSSNTAVIPNGNISLGGTGSTRTIDITAPGGSSGTTTITITLDDGNCTNVYTYNVTVNPLPSVSAGPDQTECEGNSVILTGSGTAISYNWDNSVTDGVAFTPGIGTVTYTVTGTDGNGCINSDQVDVTINALPVVSFGALSDFCTNDSPYAFIEGTPGGGTYTGTGVTANTFDPVSAGTGVHNITYTYTDGNGCSDNANQNVTVHAYTPASFNTLTDICDNAPIYGLTEGSPSGGIYSGPGVTGSNFDPGAVGSGSYTLYYDYTDGNGCSDQANQNINVLASPNLILSIDQTICEGESATISASGASSYSWDNGLGAGASHLVSPTVTTLYVVTGTGANGCVKIDTTTVTVNALPTVTFSPLADMCLDASPYSLVEGSPSGGIYSGTGVSGGILDPISAGTGTHWIYYDYTDGGTGCSNSDSTTVLIYDSPNVIANATATNICDGDAVTLTGSGATTYTWDNSVTDGVAFNPAIGSVTYTVTGTDANGCQGTDQIMVTVNALPTVSAGGDQTICQGSSVTLSGSGASSYAWDNGVTDGVAFNPSVGTLTYTVVGTDGNGCQNYDQVDVTVNPNPVLTVSADQTFCLGDVINLTASGATSYDWDSGASSTSNYSLSPTSSVTVQVIGTELGCSSTENIILTLDDPSLVDAGPDIEICEGFTTNISATGGIDYVWNGPDANNVNSQSINVQVDTSDYYFVSVTTSFGCTYSDSVFVAVSTDPNCTINAVTTITPNGDAVNDFWKIQGIEGFPDNHVVIFNRWGDKVFDGEGYDNNIVKWEGTNLNGEDATGGTYYYIIEIENTEPSTGWIQLLK